MRVMVIVKATAEFRGRQYAVPGTAGGDGRVQSKTDRGRGHARRRRRQRSALGARVAFEGPDRKVIPGPFAATGELVSGFWIWKVASLEEAIDWVKQCPNPMPGPSEIEIRPLFEMEDFAEQPCAPGLEAQARNV